MMLSKQLVKLFQATVLIVINISLTLGQNIVVNPSFEITNTNCANLGGEGFRTDLDPSWDNANSNLPGDSCSSPDLFSACNTLPIPGFSGATGVPGSVLGWQYAHTGTRYAGLILYEAPFGIKDNYREYIQGHTTTPLVAGQTYCVSFYISLANKVQYASENIGIYFSNTHVSRDACTAGSLLPYTPQLTNTCGVLMDTANWVRLQWNYTATGGEQYFIIGNFKDKNNTPIHNGYGSAINPYAYYIIDDVSIEANTCCYAEITPPSSPCINDAPFNLTASSGVGCSLPPPSGTWSGPGITDATNGTFDPSIAGVGSHTIEYTLSCGYVASLELTVKSCNLSVCKESNGDYTVSNGTGPYTWSEWSPSTPITVTDQTSCEACGGSWTFGQCLSSGFPPTPITSCSSAPGFTQFATGTTVTPTTNFPIIVVDNNNDTLTINSASEVANCTGCPTITVTTSNVTNPSCNNNNGSADCAASGGSGSYTYTWQPGNLSGATQSNLSAGTYTITATDINGCTGTATITLNASSAPNVSINTSSNISCNGFADGTATATISGGATPYSSIVWNTTPPQNGNTASNLSAGNYQITVTDAGGCSASDDITITEPTGITASTNSSDATCGNTDGSATVSASGGTGILSYLWDDASNQTTSTASNLSAGSYQVLITDANGCVDSANVVVNNTNGPIITIDSTNNVSCFGGTDGMASISVNGGQTPYSYSWTPTGGTSNMANNLPAGEYTVEITDNSGCTNSSIITITEPTPIEINATITPTDCGKADGSIAINVSGGTPTYNYIWSSGQNTANISNLNMGNYTLTIHDAKNCSIDSSFYITMNGGLSVDAQPKSSTIHKGESVGITVYVPGSQSNYIYSWTPPTNLSCIDCPNPKATPDKSTIYIVSVTDTTTGCVGMDTILITVNNPCANIYIPNMFSPNIDGKNDNFCVKGGCIRKYNLKIYDRWGEKIFESNSIHDCWDGRYKDKELNTGVYIYKIHIVTLDGKVIDKSGNINLIR